MESEKERPVHRENPRVSASLLSALTFSWTFKTFWKGYKRDLDPSDFFTPLKEHTSSFLGDHFEKKWKQECVSAKKEKRNPSLIRVIFRTFGFQIILYGIVLAVMEIIFRIYQPLFLGSLLNYFHHDSEVTKSIAYLHALGIIVCSAVNVMVIHPFMMATMHIGMKIRLACCSLIYRKTLKLSKTALREATIGQIVNLLANDVSRFDSSVIFFHYLWIGPVQTLVVTYLLWKQIGIASLVGVAALISFIPLQAWLGKKTSSIRLNTAIRTDKRVRLMNEIIYGIQVIKMYTWEKPFANLVSEARRKEINEIKKTAYIRGILSSFNIFHIRVAIFVSVLAYVWSDHVINAQKVFIVTSYYHVLQHTLTTFMPKAITMGAEALVSAKRLQNLLLLEECELKPIMEEDKPAVTEVNGKGDYNKAFIQEEVSPMLNEAICISHATAKWSPDLNDNTLNDITLSIKPGQLIGVIGSVGAGKSSLLLAILRELPLTKGYISVSGKISYASQEPWLFAGSVRQNILFGAPYDKKRYKKVIEVCALWRDFRQLMFGDKTIVGERGVSLSGGQKARINLARAVYKQADIYLLDDPLSAVDTHVGKHLFEQCIVGFLKSKTCILVTHQLHHLDRVDKIALMQNGSFLATGKYNDLRSSEKDFSQIILSAVADTTPVVEDIKPARVRHLSHQSVASSMDGNEEEEDQSLVSENYRSGNIGAYVFKDYFAAAGHKFLIGLMFFMCVLTQLLANGGDYWITHWVNLEEHSYPYQEHVNVTKQFALHKDRKYYLYTSREMCIYIFTTFIIATLVVTLLRSYIFFSLCMKASTHLHNNMFYSLTRATMSFFHTNPAGRILNRFSKDIGSVDEGLPTSLIECIQKGLTLLGVLMVVAFMNHFIIVPTIIVFILIYYVRRFYVSTSRSVKRLEGIARSPVFSHISASLQGLATIRAFQAEQILTHEFDQHQDNHSSAWYIFLATSRAFGFWLDVMCLIYIAIVVLSFLFLDSDFYGGSVGLSITQVMSLTGNLQFGMRQSAELENIMTSVERVLEYSYIESEPPLETPEGTLPSSWPQEGKIQFQNVSMRYAVHLPRVLKDVTFTIEPQKKVGIIGRTGAGKSSLITALFRLHDITGCIYIDEVPIHTIGLHQLRSKISIIPQEPVLFSGSIRNNLDPFDEYPDDVLWNALEEVELKTIVTELTGGLEWKMAEGGANFSVGQRQLMCLARAIIRNNRILVLDEATANVDPQTDGLIQSTIRRKFANCTVLTIAHRLHTIMDSDMLLVMDTGVLVEMDHPFKLLLNKNGRLYGMVKEAGRNAAESLHSIAASNFKRSHHLDLETVKEV